MMKMNFSLFGETRQHTLEPNQSNRKMTLTVKELAEELISWLTRRISRLSGLVGGC